MKRSALEALFARAAQGRIFLLLLAGGLLLGGLLTLAGMMRRRIRLLGAALDALCALVAGAMVLGAMLLSGDGLRLYALLGLALGAALYMVGVQPAVSAAGRAAMKIFRRRQE